MRFTLVTELETDRGRRRGGLRRPPSKRSIDVEPENAKGRTDAGATRNGAITC